METVALEWISSVGVKPQDVVHFVQQLNNVPKDAVCEIGEIFSRRCRTTFQKPGNQHERRNRNEIHLTCEPRVAEFLCKKFSKQTQHITGGEVIQVRCKRVYHGAQPLGKRITTRIMRSDRECVEDVDETMLESKTEAEPSTSALVLPIDKVIALIDLLGEKVVDAQEAYDLFSERDACGPQRMTMLGLTKALLELCRNEWTTKLSRVRGNSSTCNAKITVENTRYLLSRLIASNNVAVKRIPAATTVPFVSYTDFLATYVAFLASLHSST
ncbi:hypothetical protein F444_20757 [Phytophthora nicotianae P1976]|uniref:Uncharacterized protein n=1 Tax=Phytophthora nicotianae P1976 TaxID=1317066 RepID=A0A080Z3H8_PHYNI|nr:hypothetical protein F444_20757 [Phytophthora nicotianae P1976]